MVENDFTLTKRMLDLILNKDSLKKKAKKMKFIGCIGIGVELAVLSFLLVKLAPIMVINGLMFGIVGFTFGLYGFSCYMINKFISSNLIKPVLNEVQEIDAYEKKLREMIKRLVKYKGITLDDKSFKLFRVHSYTSVVNSTSQIKSTNKSNNKIIKFNGCSINNSYEENEFIAAADKKNKVFGYIRIVTNYEDVKGLNNGVTQPKASWEWLGPERLSEVPAEIKARAEMLYKADWEKSKPKTRIRRPEPIKVIYR